MNTFDSVKWIIALINAQNLALGRGPAGRATRRETAGCLHTWWCPSAPAWEHKLQARLYSCPCILRHSRFQKTHSWRDRWRDRGRNSIIAQLLIHINFTGNYFNSFRIVLTLSSGWGEYFPLRLNCCRLGSCPGSTAKRCACSCADSLPGHHSDNTRWRDKEVLIGRREIMDFLKIQLQLPFPNISDHMFKSFNVFLLSLI